MMIKSLFSLSMVLGLLSNLATAQSVNENETLSVRQQRLVAIAAFTATGDQKSLATSLHEGLDAGLTINEIKEVMVQLYAYAGFPRSLNALNTYMAVLKERKQNGIVDAPGSAANPLPTTKNKLESGTDIQTRLVGAPIKGEIYEFAPAIDQFLKEHLFWDIFGRDNLDFKTRELATIAALASMSGVDNQLASHFRVGMYNGLSKSQLKHLVVIIQTSVGQKTGDHAHEVLQRVLNPTGESATPVDKNTSDDESSQGIFPKGEKITNTNFTGTAWLQSLVDNDPVYHTPVGHVTFEPGARTKWHFHPGGQILLVLGGTGYYQEKGSAKKILRKGDVIKCPPNVVHWHGASADEEFIQIAITPPDKGSVVWLQPVTDEEYTSKIKP